MLTVTFILFCVISSGLPNLQRIIQCGFAFEKECKSQIIAFCGKEEDTCYFYIGRINDTIKFSLMWTETDYV